MKVNEVRPEVLADLQREVDNWARELDFYEPVEVGLDPLGRPAVSRLRENNTGVVHLGSSLLLFAPPRAPAAAAAHEVVHVAKGHGVTRQRRLDEAFRRLAYCNGMLGVAGIPVMVTAPGFLYAVAVSVATVGLGAVNRLMLHWAEAARCRREELVADVEAARLMGDVRPMQSLLKWLAVQPGSRPGSSTRLGAALLCREHPPLTQRLAALERAAPAIAAEAASRAASRPEQAPRSVPSTSVDAPASKPAAGQVPARNPLARLGARRNKPAPAQAPAARSPRHRPRADGTAERRSR